MNKEQRRIATVRRLLAKEGWAAQLRRPGTKSGPPHNPVFSDPTVLNVVVFAFPYDSSEVDGTRIKAMDRHVYMSPVATDESGAEISLDEVTTSDVLIDNGELSIVKPGAIKSSNVTIMHELQCRR